MPPREDGKLHQRVGVTKKKGEKAKNSKEGKKNNYSK